MQRLEQAAPASGHDGREEATKKNAQAEIKSPPSPIPPRGANDRMAQPHSLGCECVHRIHLLGFEDANIGFGRLDVVIRSDDLRLRSLEHGGHPPIGGCPHLRLMPGSVDRGRITALDSGFAPLNERWLYTALEMPLKRNVLAECDCQFISAL
jgi:hypothetical protein